MELDKETFLGEIEGLGEYVYGGWDELVKLNDKIAKFTKKSNRGNGVVISSISETNRLIENDLISGLKNIDNSIFITNEYLYNISDKIDQFLGGGGSIGSSGATPTGSSSGSFDIDVFMDSFGNKALDLLEKISEHNSYEAESYEDYLKKRGLEEVEYNDVHFQVKRSAYEIAKKEGYEYEFLRNEYDEQKLNNEDKRKRTKERKIERSKGYKAAKNTIKYAGDFGSFMMGGIKDPASMTASKVTTSVGNGLASGLSAFGPWGKLAGEIVKGITAAISAAFELINEVQKPAQEYARTIGGGAKAYRKMQISAAEVAKKSSDWSNTLFQAKDYIEAITKYQGEFGRKTEMSEKSWESITVLMKTFNMSERDLANLGDFGLNGERMEKYMFSAYQYASKTGVAFSKMGESLKTNIKLASKYSFKEGLNDLTKMAEKSASLKMDMQQIMAFGDKVKDVEGAVNTAANLSVLGGDFARFADPMQMLNESLTDRGALSKRVEEMIKGKSFWNEEKKMIDMNPYDRERIRAAANSMGMSDDTLFDMIQRTGISEKVSEQINSSAIRGNDGLMEYVKNTSSLDEDGNAKIIVGSIEKMVSELTDDDIKQLNRDRNISEDSMKSVAVATMTINDHVAGIWMMMKNYVVKLLGKIVGTDESQDMIDQETDPDEKIRLEKLRDEANKNIDKDYGGRVWGTVIGGGLGALLGAAIGTLVAPGAGTAAGAAKGAMWGAGIAGTIGGIGGYYAGDKIDTFDNGQKRAEYMRKNINTSAGGIDDIPDDGQNIDGKRGMLSILHPHETVLPANLAEDMRNTFKILHSSTKTDVTPTNTNTLSTIKVKSSRENRNANTLANNLSTRIELAPLKIDGTIKLDLGNNSVNVDANKLLNNSIFIENLSRIMANKIKDVNNYGKANVNHRSHWDS